MKHAKQIKNDDMKQLDNQLIWHEQKASTRLNKFISETGYCSRRQADRLIEQGLVYIDGQRAQTGQQVFNHQQVVVEGHLLNKDQQLVYIALNKPVGITCTTRPDIEENIADFMNYEQRIFPIGRLDKDSLGLILMTNDGDIVNKILRAKNNHEKEYIVSVDRDLDQHFVNAMSQGVPILDQITKPCQVEIIEPRTFRIILTQGLNRQIRRMCKALNYKVIRLERIRIMNITLNDLPNGYWRYLTVKELETLNELIADSDKVDVVY